MELTVQIDGEEVYATTAGALLAVRDNGTRMCPAPDPNLHVGEEQEFGVPHSMASAPSHRCAGWSCAPESGHPPTNSFRRFSEASTCIVKGQERCYNRWLGAGTRGVPLVRDGPVPGSPGPNLMGCKE